MVWRAYHTGPDKDVLIGPDFKPFYPKDQGADLGVNTWQGDQWKRGGGTQWGWVSYDPEPNLIFYGTGNPGTWNADQASRRQQVEHHHIRPRSGNGPGQMGLSDCPA